MAYPGVESLRILGVRVDIVTVAQALSLMEEMVATRRPHQVVTVNPEFVMRAQADRGFAGVLEAADLALPDGQGVLWASRRMGRPLRERVTGSDTVPMIAALSAERGYRLYLLGAGPGVAEKAAAALAAQYPGVKIVGVYAGSPAEQEADAIVARVRAVQPDFLFVAYGAPAQDRWIHRHLAALGIPVCMGVGGTFDFLAGVTPRAPLWMRERGLEWAYRLWREPWRWRRMLALPRYAWCVLREGRGKRSRAVRL